MFWVVRPPLGYVPGQRRVQRRRVIKSCTTETVCDDIGRNNKPGLMTLN